MTQDESRNRDHWSAATSYEDYMGRWSRQLAPGFLSWLRLPRDTHWLDVGCGTGALTEAICKYAAPASVTACDPAAAFVDWAREQGYHALASFVVAGTGGLPARPEGYGSAASLLALNFFPDPAAAVREMQALVVPGGSVSACVWDYSGRMDFLRCFWDAVLALDADARQLDEGVRFRIAQPAALTELFRAAGLDDVRCEPLEIPTVFASFEDFWRPMLAGTGPAPTYVASLDEDRRIALARKLDRDLPRGLGGSIALTARAWAVRGVRR
jgi:SAM-dependent methyltransferase